MDIKEKRYIEIYDVSKFILVFLTSIILMASIFFFLGIPISPIYLFFAVLVAAWFIYKGTYSFRNTVEISAISIIVITFCVMMASAVFDHTWDGSAYHKQAVGLLKDGWDPVYQSAADFNRISQSTPFPGDNPLKWADVYPKATWYIASAFYSLTGNIESGKAYTLLFMFIAFGVYFDYLKSKFKNVWKSILVAIIAAFNPISLSQFQSYYLDGAVACALLTLMIVIIAFFDSDYKRDKYDLYTIMFCLIVFTCNTKFSVILFTATLCIIFFIYSLWKKAGNYLKRFIFLFVAALISLLVVGFSPLITNLVRYGDPLYGFAGLVTHDNMAATFGIPGLSNAEMFILSLFGKMSHGEFHTVHDLLKLPFTFSDNELAYYSYVDTRVGGFGIFFSGILILSVVIIFIAMIKHKIVKGTPFWLGIIMLVVFCIEMSILPTTFTARYIPQIYFAVLLALIIGFIFVENLKMLKKKLFAVCISILCLLVFANIAPYSRVIIDNINDSKDTAAVLQYIGEKSKGKDLYIALYSWDFTGIQYNLKDYGVENYTKIDFEKVDTSFSNTYSYWLHYKFN